MIRSRRGMEPCLKNAIECPLQVNNFRPPSKMHHNDYVLATGEQAAERLLLLDQIFGPSTQDLLKTAGLAPGMHVAEIGCGSGLVAAWMAKMFGAAVTAVDASDEQLQVAAKSAAAAGLKTVAFRVGNAYDTGLPRASFDLVYSRFLMCHLAEPLKALIEQRALLKPAGTLVCEDHDIGGIFTEPPSRAYKRLVEISNVVDRSRGLDPYIGLKLPRLFQEAGFKKPGSQVKQITVLRGDAKRFWEMTLREAASAILATGASSQGELDSICAEMRAIADDPSVVLMLARVTQVWARKGD